MRVRVPDGGAAGASQRIPFYLLLVVIIVYIGFPFYWAIRSAFTPDSELFKTPVRYFPANPTLGELQARSSRAATSGAR